MKKIAVFGVLVLLLGFITGCATVAESKARTRVVKSQADVEVYDNEMYIARSRIRHHLIDQPKDGDLVAILKKSAPEADIFTSQGYKDGQPVKIINKSYYDLDIDITDTHGQVFNFELEKDKDCDFELEVGNHYVRSFRQKEANRRPFTETVMGVKSEPYFHYKNGIYSGYTIIRGGSGWGY